MRYKLNLLILLVFGIFLSACNSDSNEAVSINEAAEDINQNRINSDELVSGVWIDFSGNEQNNSSMYRTEKIEIDPDEDYILSRNAYVSFYKNDEFIRTERYQGGFNDFPFDFKPDEESNQVIFSFYEKWKDEISFSKK